MARHLLGNKGRLVHEEIRQGYAIRMEEVPFRGRREPELLVKVTAPDGRIVIDTDYENPDDTIAARMRQVHSFVDHLVKRGGPYEDEDDNMDAFCG